MVTQSSWGLLWDTVESVETDETDDATPLARVYLTRHCVDVEHTYSLGGYGRTWEVLRALNDEPPGTRRT